MQPSPIEETVRADLPSVRRFNDMCSICASFSCLLAAFAARFYAGLIGEFAAFCGCRGPNSTLLMGVHGFLFQDSGRSVISQKAKYALRALVALARKGEPMMIGEISLQERIPRKFLEQILLELKRHGILQSKRGKHGGYDL